MLEDPHLASLKLVFHDAFARIKKNPQTKRERTPTMPPRQNRQIHPPTLPLPRILLVTIAHLPIMDPPVPTFQNRFPEAVFHGHFVAVGTQAVAFEFEPDERVREGDVVEEGVL